MSAGWDAAEAADGAPDALGALRAAKDRSEAPFESLEEFVECAAWWDALLLMDDHGVSAATAHEDQVVCRKCGEWFADVREHLVVQGEDVDEYRRQYPAAPLTPRERAFLPSVDIAW